MKVKRKFDRRNSIRCIEYWLSRGFTEEQGRKEISARQSRGLKNKGSKRTLEQRKNISNALKKVYEDPILREHAKNNLIKADQAKKAKGFNYRTGTPRCIEFWLDRGYTEDQGRREISLRQSRSLDFFIKQYGHDDGHKRWNRKIKRWRTSFDQNDKEEINTKRKLNAHVGYYTVETSKNFEHLHLYAILVKDTDNKIFIKYGLTKHDYIQHRWPVSVPYEVVFFCKMNSTRAVEAEQTINSMFRNSYIPKIIKTTECCEYNAENLNKIIEVKEIYDGKVDINI
jgi:hypothetical protein